jgi:excisionase family DNA binding protein
MDKLLNNKEAATLLGISPYTLRGIVGRREISFIRIGRRILFDPKDLEKFKTIKRVPQKN